MELGNIRDQYPGYFYIFLYLFSTTIINIVDFALEVIYSVMISEECSLTVSLLFVLEIVNERDLLLHQETLPSAVIQVRQLLRSTVSILCTFGVFFFN